MHHTKQTRRHFFIKHGVDAFPISPDSSTPSLLFFCLHNSPRESGVASASSSPEAGCTTPSTVPSLTSSSSAAPSARTPRPAASIPTSPAWPARMSTRDSLAFPRRPGPCKLRRLQEKVAKGRESKFSFMPSNFVFSVHLDHLVLDRLYYWANTVL